MNSNIENMLLAQVIHSTPAMKKYFTHGISLKHYHLVGFLWSIHIWKILIPEKHSQECEHLRSPSVRTFILSMNPRSCSSQMVPK